MDRQPGDQERLELIRKLRLSLEDALGEQKMDLVIFNQPLDTFQKIILETGVVLWTQSR